MKRTENNLKCYLKLVALDIFVAIALPIIGLETCGRTGFLVGGMCGCGFVLVTMVVAILCLCFGDE